MELLLFDDAIYKDTNFRSSKPPKSIFLPDRELIRSMIYTVIESGSEIRSKFHMRFGLLDNYIEVFKEIDAEEKSISALK